MMDSSELPSSSTRIFSGVHGSESQRALMEHLISQRERCVSLVDVEMIDQLLTLEVLCPRASGLCDVSSDRESPLQYEFGECVG